MRFANNRKERDYLWVETRNVFTIYRIWEDFDLMMKILPRVWFVTFTKNHMTLNHETKLAENIGYWLSVIYKYI